MEILTKKIAVFLALAVLIQPLAAREASWQLMDGVLVHPEYRGSTPKRSDVIFSPRFKRDNALEIAKAYGATRVEWSYSVDPDYVARLNREIGWYGGAINSVMPLPSDDGLARDFEGKPIVAPWMKSWGAKWITTASPTTRETIRSAVTKYLSLGAKSIQVDDPLLQLATHVGGWGGDFSDASIRGFREFLGRKQNLARALGIERPETFDYKRFLVSTYGFKTTTDYTSRYASLPTTPAWAEYLREAVETHYVDLRKFMDSYGKGRIPLSMNLLLQGPRGSLAHMMLASIADYAIAETDIDDIDLLSYYVGTYRSLGLGYAPSIRPIGLEQDRIAIALFYALGAQPLVPWDVYVAGGPDARPSRHFGDPKEYGDLYAFVRRNAALFDEFDSIATVGILVPKEKFDRARTVSLSRELARNNVPFAFVVLDPASQRDPAWWARLSKFKVLLTVNQEEDFPGETLREIDKRAVRRMSSFRLNPTELAALAPFVLPSNSGYRAIARVRTSRVDQSIHLVIHLVDIRAGMPSEKSSDCNRQVRLRKQDLGQTIPVSAVWHSIGGKSVVKLQRSQAELVLQAQDCSRWGLFSVSLK